MVGLAGPEDAVTADQQVAVDERRHQPRAEHAGEVVVTRPGEADRLGPGALPQRADRRSWGKAGEGLEQVADLGTGDPEVPVPAVLLDREQAAVEEFAQMGARG